MRYIALMPPPYDDWSTRHNVSATAQRTAALVNALAVVPPDPGAGAAHPADGFRTAADAVADVLRAYGEPDPVSLTPDDLADMRAAAARLREVFAADHVDVAAARLNALLAAGTGPLRLTSHGGGSPWHPHLDSDDDAPWAEWFLASSCMALAVLIWDGQCPPGGLCASPSCPNVYLAQGRGPARRYCSRRCATRERVSAHRARARAEAREAR
jgi:predicted RNA-binding Zn ribbon-like protein